MLSHEETIYREAILELYRNPLNKKKLTNPTASHREFNPSCGDEIEIAIAFDAEDRVTDIGHQGQGCAISQAAVSLLTEEMKGKTKDEIKKFTKNDMLVLLGIPISYTRENCALLGFKALKQILC